MMTLHLCHNVTLLKFEHQRLLESEEKLSTYDERLKQEREKMTTEERFTKRETEIARLICTGLTNKAIGETLFISERTVAKHMQSIFEKAKVSNRFELYHKLDTSGFARIGDENGKNENYGI